jgi:mRNA interferase RelE/StbE
VAYKVRLIPEAERSLASLQLKQQRQVARKISALADDPRPVGCRRLQGSEHLYRIVSGDYRIIYQIHDDVLTVLVVRIGDRKQVYRRLPGYMELEPE